MNFFRVCLSGSAPRGSAPGRESGPDPRLQRQVCSYVLHPAWLPAGPVRVVLSGPRGRRLPAGRRAQDVYELPLVAPRSRRLARGLAAAVAAAAFVVPLSQAEAQPLPADPAVPRLEAPRAPEPDGPPTSTLVGERRGAPQGMVPVLDEKGQPVLLGSFHSNVSGNPHQNAAHVHSNVWSNHANTFAPHANTWSNHTNVPSYVVPHTNITPGDFIF